MITIRIGKDTVTPWLQQAQAELKNPRALAAGINRTMQSAQTLAVRQIQADVGAGAQKTIRRNISLKKASGEKTHAELIAVSAKKERIPIYDMKPRPRTVTRRRPPGGVSYGPTSKLIPGSFIAQMRSGHVGVFKRIGTRRIVDDRRYLHTQAGVLQRTSRALQADQITELFGPSVALVFSRKKITDQIKNLITEKIPAEVARAFKFLTK